MKLGDKGIPVQRLQQALQRENLLPKNTSRVKHDDGIFGKGTERAVKAYQQILGVDQTGIVGNYFADKIGINIKDARVIVLTAGHNSTRDSGAVSKDGKYTEAKVVTDLRNRVKDILSDDGYIVIVDGVGEENLSLTEAVKLIPLGDIAIELHLNASDNSQANGIEVLAKSKFKPQSKIICQSISGDMGYKIRGEGGWKSTDSGQHSRLAFCEANGLILEIFFISNRKELDTYINEVDKLAKSIADAIIKAL